jgi:hypothetical protein
MVEIFAAKSAAPTMGHLRERPARKKPSLDLDFRLMPE